MMNWNAAMSVYGKRVYWCDLCKAFGDHIGHSVKHERALIERVLGVDSGKNEIGEAEPPK